MNTIDTSRILTQLKAAAAMARSEPAAEVAGTAQGSFASLLTQSIDKVNEMQKESSDLKTSFELGDRNVSLSQVMIAGNKASLGFQGLVQVRNKMVEAYQEVMRMQV